MPGLSAGGEHAPGTGWRLRRAVLERSDRAARRLPAAARAAYRALAMRAQAAPGLLLPADDDELAAIAQVSPAAWRRLRPALAGVLGERAGGVAVLALEPLRLALRAAAAAGRVGGLVKGAKERFRRERERLGEGRAARARLAELAEELILRLLPAWREAARLRAELHGDERQGRLDLAAAAPDDGLGEERRVLARLLGVVRHLELPARLVEEVKEPAVLWLVRRQRQGRLGFCDLLLALVAPQGIEEAWARIARATGADDGRGWAAAPT